MDELDFTVTVRNGYEDLGEVTVTVEVDSYEYDVLKDCWRDDMDISEYPGLEELYERVKEAAKEESKANELLDSDEETDYDELVYIIEMPDQIVDEVEEEDEEEGRNWDNYENHPFAMEVTNGEILSMTIDFQETVKERILRELHVSEEDLANYLLYLRDSDEPFDERFERISNFDYDALQEILGFNEEKKAFTPTGIGFLESPYGWQAKDLLKELGFELEENVDYGTHGHGVDGVIFIPEE